MPKKDRVFDLEAAETIALKVLAFLAEDPARLGRFLAITGVGPAELRSGAGEPRMMASVLEYILGDESLLLMFASNAGVAPESIQPASDQLVLSAARQTHASRAP